MLKNRCSIVQFPHALNSPCYSSRRINGLLTHESQHGLVHTLSLAAALLDFASCAGLVFEDWGSPSYQSFAHREDIYKMLQFHAGSRVD